MKKDDLRRILIGIFQQSRRADIGVHSEYDDLGEVLMVTFYQSESRTPVLKLTKEQLESHTANEILDMLGAKE